METQQLFGGHERWAQGIYSTTGEPPSFDWQAQTATYGDMSETISQTYPRLMPVTSQASSPDYFTFAASFRSHGGILGSGTLSSDSLGPFPLKPLVIPSQTQSDQARSLSSIDVNLSTFPGYPQPVLVGPDSPGSHTESSTFSPLSPSTPALASSLNSSEGIKGFFTQEELLFLSPQQCQILQEAHFEARRRASLPEQPFGWVPTCQQGRRASFVDPGSMHQSVSLPSMQIPVEQPSAESTGTAPQQLDDRTLSAFFGYEGQGLGAQYQAVPQVVRPIPVRPGLAQILEESSNEGAATHEVVDLQACSFTELGSAQPPSLDKIDQSAAAAGNNAPSDLNIPTIDRVPSANTFRNSANAKIKQLGTCPADEAFASSLDQLKSCGEEKPPYLWWTLIRAALLGSSRGKLQMDSLCAVIMEKFPYFGTAKEAKNWKSSIRSVIHTKPCFVKTELKDKTVWWSVDVNIDPREQRRGLKKRSLSTSSCGGDSKRPTFFKTSMDQLSEEVEEEEDDSQEERVDEDGSSYGGGTGGSPKKRRRTN